ncbi:MAG: phosphatidate cytidylyltransferase [Chloroflexi bacterium]|nr:phosphatidate cytidylyltransferase [Chloroflexota bacterium]
MISVRDILGIILSFVLAFGMIGVAEFSRRRWGVPRQVTRKAIHIAAGMWVLGIIAIFDHWWMGIIPPAAFILLNYLFWKHQIFKAMDALQEGWGTVAFAFSITLLLALFWSQGRPEIPAAGLMPMVWGDSSAALVGTYFGRHKYSFRGQVRSWEGSAAMFTFGFLATWLALLALGLPESSLTNSLIVAGGATVVEAISPKSADNLTVPFVSCGLLYVLIVGG